MPERAKILVVEDSPMMARMYRLVLGAEHEVLLAENGVQGLDWAARQPDLALAVVDINMPQMDGLEFLRRLRGELQRTELPVLVCSTEAAESDRQAALAAGATRFLPKPWTPAQFAAVVAELLGEAP